jgi:hypothetical protein
MELVKHNALSVGRAEDWLQFWFQLSLAAKRFEKKELFNLFIAQAQSMVQKITQHLSEEQKDYFLRRPDIARLFRISEPVVPQQEVQVKAQQITSEQESAAATLAPPVSAKPTRESQ